MRRLGEEAGKKVGYFFLGRAFGLLIFLRRRMQKDFNVNAAPKLSQRFIHPAIVLFDDLTRERAL